MDRPPPLIALVRLTDAIGGVPALRWVAAAGCALLVLAAVALAREVARSGAAGSADRAAVLTAIGTTALVSNASIDLVFAKGEVLSLPLLVGSAWLTVRAVRTRSAPSAAWAGLLAGVAIGLKQNLYDGIVFAAVLLVGEAVRRTLHRRDLARLGGAFVAAALLPAVVTVVWAVAAGVRLSALWYAVYGFRKDAFDTILVGPLAAPERRAAHLLILAVATGLVVTFVWFLLSLRRLAGTRPVLTVATTAVLLAASVSIALGGSYWRPYLFELVPAAVLALAMLTTAVTPDASTASATASRRGPLLRPDAVTDVVVAVVVTSCIIAGVRWVGSWGSQRHPTTSIAIGRAVRAASHHGDTLTVWGGGADIQLASGLSSPYVNLWSLPARTRDPGSTQLAAVLAGPQAPTWFLAWADLDAWRDGTRAAVEPVLHDRYVSAGPACGGHDIYRLREVLRSEPRVSCPDLATTTSRPS